MLSRVYRPLPLLDFAAGPASSGAPCANVSADLAESGPPGGAKHLQVFPGLVGRSRTGTFFSPGLFRSARSQTHLRWRQLCFLPRDLLILKAEEEKAASAPAGVLGRRARCASSPSTSSRGGWRRGRSTTAAVSGSGGDGEPAQGHGPSISIGRVDLCVRFACLQAALDFGFKIKCFKFVDCIDLFVVVPH